MTVTVKQITDKPWSLELGSELTVTPWNIKAKVVGLPFIAPAGEMPPMYVVRFEDEAVRDWMRRFGFSNDGLAVIVDQPQQSITKFLVEMVFDMADLAPSFLDPAMA